MHKFVVWLLHVNLIIFEQAHKQGVNGVNRFRKATIKYSGSTFCRLVNEGRI